MCLVNQVLPRHKVGMDIKARKMALRRESLARRDALDERWRAEAGIGMAERGRQGLRLARGTVVAGFWPMRSEADVRPLMLALREGEARLCLPAILDKTTIVFREFLSDAALVDMGYGTLGPGEGAETLDPATILVPLAAFDGRGHRLGYGAGYYDRAIAKLKDKGRSPRLIGIAFDCQEVAEVPNEPHDVPLPEILTESGFHRFPRELDA